MMGWSSAPEDFDREWTMSDIVIYTEENKKLFANKTMLATFSPYFHALFFSNFKDANSDHTIVETEYDTMREILRIIYNVNRPMTPGAFELYPLDFIYCLYRAADKYDFPMIRELCKAQLIASSNASHAIAIARNLEIEDVQAVLLGKLTTMETIEFFDGHEGKFTASMKDLATIMRKIEEETKRNHETEMLSPAVRELLDNIRGVRLSPRGRMKPKQRVLQEDQLL